MTKIAGASLIGFCAVSLGADKVNLGPMASQLAGFVGAFIGSLAAQRQQQRRDRPDDTKNDPAK